MELKYSKKELAIEILKKIKSAIERLEERTKDIKSVDDFLMSSYGMEKLDASCMLLIAIGESIKSFDKITDKKVLCEDASIPWTEIMGVRDIIAHHYFDIDAEEIYNIIKFDLKPLLQSIDNFIDKLHNVPSIL
jgi:uncharacterized protein with HEPN domain